MGLVSGRSGLFSFQGTATRYLPFSSLRESFFLPRASLSSSASTSLPSRSVPDFSISQNLFKLLSTRFITNKTKWAFLYYSWSGSQMAPPPVEHLGVSHRQHEATLSSVRFLTKLHFHEEGGGDFENNHLFHTCGPLGNLSPYDQRLGNENTTVFLKRSSSGHPLLCHKTPCKTTPRDRNSGRENMDALYCLALSLLQQYENFASCSVPGNSVLSVV